MTKKVCVVGAGLVGSLWSIYLAKYGYEVDVYEKRPDMRMSGAMGGRSINLALSDRGWKALEGVGVADEVRKMAIPMKGRMIHNEDGTGHLLPYGLHGQAIYSVSRAGLNEVLMTLAEETGKTRFHFKQGLEKANLAGGKLAFAGADEKEYDLVFGADGAFSAMRLNMMLQMPRFNYSQQFLEHGYKELTIPPAPGGGWLMDKNALHIWPRHSFMLIALANRDGSFTCTLFLPFEGEESFEKLKEWEDIKTFFAKYFPDALEMMPTLQQDFQENPSSALVTVKCSPWNYDDKALILGDASHAIVPFYGQGMNSGFEDCTVLNELAEKYHKNWEHILPLFSEQRKPDADAIAELALRNFVEMRDSVADPHFLRKRELSRKIGLAYPEDWIPTYSMVTFSHIPYSQALQLSDAQNEILEELAAMKNAEELIGSEKFVPYIQQYKAAHKEITW